MSTRTAPATAPSQQQPFHLKDAPVSGSHREEGQKEAAPSTGTNLSLSDRSTLMDLFSADRGLGKEKTLAASLLHEANWRLRTLQELYPRGERSWGPLAERLDACGFIMDTRKLAAPTMTPAEKATYEERFLDVLSDLRERTRHKISVTGYISHKDEEKALGAVRKAFNQVGSSLALDDSLGQDIRTQISVLQVSVPNLGGDQELDLFRLRTQVVHLLADKGLLK